MLELEGEDFLERWPAAAQKLYLLAFTNVLMTAGAAVSVSVLASSAVVPWSEWVAAWETDGEECDSASGIVPLHWPK